jgi:hypothetical protein
MTHNSAVRWSCRNSDCKWSMVATVALPGEPAPRCVCGDLMQRVASNPAPTYLGFLHGESAADDQRVVEED